MKDRWNEFNFNKSYHLFYYEGKDTVSVLGKKKHLLYYLCSTCTSQSKEAKKVISIIRNKCDETNWYCLVCPFQFDQKRKKYIDIKDCFIESEVPQQIILNLKASLRKEQA